MMASLRSSTDSFIHARNKSLELKHNALLLDLIKILSINNPELLIKHIDIIDHMKHNIEKKGEINEN